MTAKDSGTAIEENLPLFKDGRGVFNCVIATVGRGIGANLEQAHCSAEDVDSWVFQQASRFVIESLSKSLGIPMGRGIPGVEEFGNMTSSAIPIALKRNIQSRDVVPETMFLFGFGVGLSWGFCLLRKA
ncbi:MAG: 3-oxoacyl-[acyl-carrier-protein] synthase III C-terminal domain-containing protein [Magnetovibrionaceae bacterium]